MKKLHGFKRGRNVRQLTHCGALTGCNVTLLKKLHGFKRGRNVRQLTHCGALTGCNVTLLKKFLAAIVALIVTATAFATALAASYIGNSNTGKFHYANCSFVGKMNSAHKVGFNTRDEAINAGYIPCKRCKP